MLRTLALTLGLSAIVTAAPASDTEIHLGDLSIRAPYARASTAMSQSGAAFMVIANGGSEDDRLIGAASPFAARVELHTHQEDAQGVMRMIEVEGGFPIPAGAEHALARGGDHLMFLGLTEAFEDGQMVPVTLTFEKAGDVQFEIPVDLTRRPMGHGKPKAVPGN